MKFSRLAVVGVVGILTISTFLMMHSASAGNEVSQAPYVDYSQPITPFIVQNENISFNGRPIARDPQTGDIYFAGGDHMLDIWLYNVTTDLFTEVYTGFAATGDGDVIRTGIVMDNGYVFVGRTYNNSVYRSTDHGATFSINLVLQPSAFLWGIAASGSYIYAGDYGMPAADYCCVYYSDDYGDSWSEAWRSVYEVSVGMHLHRIGIDPYTGYVYATAGDEFFQTVRSTDSTTFSRWGPQRRHTCMAFDESNIYFGDDPKGLFYIYNRTTEVWTTTLLGTYSLSSPLYEIVVGDDGVLYTRTFDDAVVGHPAGIWCSPDGLEWEMMVNLTGPAVDGSITLLKGEDGYIYYGRQFDSTRYNLWTYRFPDLSKDEAWAIVNQAEPRPEGASYTFDTGERAYDGFTTTASLQQDVIEDARLTVTGVGAFNMFDDGMCDSVVTLNETWDNMGWSYIAWEGPDNCSRAFVSGAGHTGDYAIRVESYNATNTTKVTDFQLRKIVPADLRQPAGTPLTVSVWLSSKYGNLTSDYQGGARGTSISFLYTDMTTQTFPFDGSTSSYGLGGGCWDEDNIQWGRRWMTWIPSLTKQVAHVKIVFTLYGNYTLYIDDIQMQYGSVYTPAIAEYAAMAESEDINVTVDGTRYEVGTLGDGETASVDLGTISGLTALEFSINGSKCVNWTITGDRRASTYNALIELDDEEVVHATHCYDDPAIEFWGGGCTVDPSTFLNPDDSSTVYLACDPLVDGVNTTILAWGSAMVWDADGSATWTVSGLSSSTGYKVYQDGVEKMYQPLGATVLIFSAAGGGEFEILAWDDSDTSLPDPEPTDTTPPSSDVAEVPVSWTGMGFLAVACATTVVILVLLMRRSKRRRGRSRG